MDWGAFIEGFGAASIVGAALAYGYARYTTRIKSDAAAAGEDREDRRQFYTDVLARLAAEQAENHRLRTEIDTVYAQEIARVAAMADAEANGKAE
jgi:hypothetical protein